MMTDPKKLEKFKNKQLKKARKTQKKTEQKSETVLALDAQGVKKQPAKSLKEWIFTLYTPSEKRQKTVGEQQPGFQVIKGKKQLHRLDL